MGFKRPIHTITFPPGHTYHGLEVRARSVSFGTLMDIQAAIASLPGGGEDVEAEDAFEKLPPKEQRRAIDRIADGFGAALVSWNLEEDDGTPVPATADVLRNEDFGLVLSVVVAWMETVSGVDADLGKDSAAGRPSVPVADLDLPVEVLPGSRSS